MVRVDDYSYVSGIRVVGESGLATYSLGSKSLVMLEKGSLVFEYRKMSRYAIDIFFSYKVKCY